MRLLPAMLGVRVPFGVPYVALAQLDRALDYESRGREFESLMRRHMTFKDIKNEDIFEFFATMGYCEWKKYNVSIENKDEYQCTFVAKGKGSLTWDCTLTHVGLHTLTNFNWVQFLYKKYGEEYRQAFLETIDDEMFFIQEIWT